jgi:hypothetical protein
MGGAHRAGRRSRRVRTQRVAPAGLECSRIAAAVLFVLAVVSTPRESFWAYRIYGIVVTPAVVARIPASHLLRRIAIELPFVASLSVAVRRAR